MRISKFLPVGIAIVVVVVAVGVVYLPHADHSKIQEESPVQVQEELVLHISKSYTVHELEDVYALADMAIQGRIVGKYSAMESRDEFGVLVGESSPSAVVSSPFLVYEVQTLQTFKGEKFDSVLVKVDGGTVGNLTVQSDHEELDIGQTVVFLLDGPFGGGLYQLVAGPYSVFEIQDGHATGKDEEMPLAELQSRLD